MTPEIVVDLLRDVLTMIVIIVSVIIGPGMLLGLVVSIFQAATQINEQTLSFLPRLLATLVTIGLAGHWLIREFMELFQRMYTVIPELIY
ncbi:flagellar biosynthetic protein FliQ [Parendozoicomonas sp. Alg238-R29]|uniref:flagellar biosynthetic protein FliQ n=1 Tax=Parendozoicomonas sp. Alg238-R29 TaxID=2993446 RepID=UPI00248E2836|nr:flagellar biosynthetic protein FliQ [Parendozoicomonas sp. Alg238-R29]